MTRTRSTKLIGALALSIAGLLGPATASVAAPAPVVQDYPAGLACAGFDLRIEIRGTSTVFRIFKDKDGNIVRTLLAGKGSALTFINLTTMSSLSLRANGAVLHTRFNPDGTQTVAATGHNVLILFPSDVPAGPSTTLHVGRVVYTVDADGVFTVQRVSGRATDICAALS